MIRMIVTMLISFSIGIITGGYLLAHKYCLKLIESRKQCEKNAFLVRLYDIWMMTKQDSISMEKFLLSRNIKSIAIYGASMLGIRLYYELKNTQVTVKFMYDKNPRMSVVGIDVRTPDNQQYEEVDVVIVTALFAFNEIEKLLNNKGHKRVIGIDEILYEMLKK